ncbi:DNA integrity scanning protein DisA nucleotide-binding domain protein [Desulforapulum autotrophicum]|nr:DNA integrity scanning protein DisA nucleotide-binding domain protein [Desulforapulum autotrophicum]
MPTEAYKNICIINIFNGLVEGLSHFSQASRAALVYLPEPESEVLIYDPQELLKGHEPRLRELYLDDPDFRTIVSETLARQPRGLFFKQKNLNLAGLISHGGSTHDFFYQMWFTEHHPDMSSIYPTERWIEHAGWLLSQEFGAENISMGTSGHALQNYTIHAITDHIIDVRNNLLGLDNMMLVHPILDTILNISKTKEEGSWARGKLIFVDPEKLTDIQFIAKIQRHERPYIGNVKHIRKLLLAVEHSTRKLVSDGKTIIGISNSKTPEFAIAANFQGDHGFLELCGQNLCSFFDGNFHSTTRKAKLVELEEILLDACLGTEKRTDLFKTIADIVHTAESRQHGCTLVVDLNPEPVNLSGHILEPCLSLKALNHLDLAKSLIKIDGALHIMADISLRGFGCLLDGKTIKGENMARGARYNSALRFTAEHDRVIVVVVSEDRPVSIIHHGIEINASCEWNPLPGYPSEPKTLQQYLNGVN